MVTCVMVPSIAISLRCHISVQFYLSPLLSVTSPPVHVLPLCVNPVRACAKWLPPTKVAAVRTVALVPSATNVWKASASPGPKRIATTVIHVPPTSATLPTAASTKTTHSPATTAAPVLQVMCAKMAIASEWEHWNAMTAIFARTTAVTLLPVVSPSPTIPYAMTGIPAP